MKKRVFSLIIAAIMLFTLSACGGTENSSSNESADVSTEQNDTKKEIAFEEIVVVDNEECTIKITDLEDGFWGYNVKAELENKSDSKTYMFAVANASVNGIQTDPFFASEVAAGKKALETIAFSSEDLEDNKIEFTDIQISFIVSDFDDWTADAVAEETINIFPFGEENAEKFVREPKESDTVLIENEKVSIILTDIDENGVWGYTWNLFIENKTDKDILVAAEDVSINGYMADPYFATTIGSNMCAFSMISWYDEDLETIGITETTDIEEIELVLRAYDYNNWNAKDFANEKITLTP